MEAPREAKFQGALLAQADEPIVAPDLEPSLGINLGERPSIVAPVVLVTVCGGLFGAAGTAAIIAAIATEGWTRAGILFFASIVGIATLVPFIIGLVLLPIQLAKRRAFDAKVKQLAPPERALDGTFEGTVIASF